MLASIYSLLLLFADFFDEWMGWLPTGLLPEVRNGFGLRYGRASLILTAHLIGGYAGSAIGGILADLWDRHRVLVFGAALYAVGLGLASLAPSFGVMLLSCGLIGLASGPVAHTAQLILADRAHASGERLERALGRYNALGSVGDLVGPGSLALGLGVGLGWRSLFAVGAMVMVIFAVSVTCAGRRSPAERALRDRPSRPTAPTLWAAIRDRRLLRLALALALLDALDEPFAGFVLLYLRDVAGVSPSTANAALGVLVGSTLGGFALVSQLAWPRIRLMRVFLTVLAAAIGMLLIAPSLPLKVVSLCLVGVTSAGFYTVALAEALSRRPETAGTTTAVLSVVGALSLLFPPLVGVIADHSGLAASLVVYAVLPLAMLGLVAGSASPETSGDVDRA